MNGDWAGSASVPRRTVVRIVLWIVALSAVLYLPWLASEPANIGLESTRALVARDMWRSGDWIVPRQNGEVYLAKPPVGNWMIALGSLPFREVTIVSARLVSALSTLALALAVALFMLRRVGSTRAAEVRERIALWSGIAVLGNLLFLDKGLHAEIEAPLALFTGLSILALFDTVWCEDRRAVRIVWTGVLLGLALLVKGPPAYLMFGMSLAGLVFAVPGRRQRALVDGSLALLVSIVVGLAWVVPVGVRIGWEASLAKFADESFKRIYDPGVGNSERWWFYLQALPGAFAPMTLMCPALFARKSPAKRGDARESSLFSMLLVWAVGATLVLSLSAAKETRYLVAVLPAWAMIAAWAWFREDPAPWLETWRKLVMRFVWTITWVLPIAVVIAGQAMREQATTWIVIAAVLLLVARVVGEVGLRTKRTALFAASVLAGLVGVRIFWAKVHMANMHDKYPVAAIGAEIRARVPVGESLVELAEYKSDIQFAADRHFRIALKREEITALLALSDARSARAHYVLARTKDLPEGDERGLVEVAAWPFGSVKYRLLRAP